jgi:hypothetical protein
MISPAAAQSANDSHRTGPGPTRTTYVFVFVPVYIEKKSNATVRPTTHGPLAKFRRASSDKIDIFSRSGPGSSTIHDPDPSNEHSAAELR